jgi:hypothetical protein
VTPQRIQLRRTKGWRKPEGAVVVARPSIWGNPFVVRPDDDAETVKGAVLAYRHALERGELPVSVALARDVLRGKDLACWCAIGRSCHADVLMELANGPRS